MLPITRSASRPWRTWSRRACRGTGPICAHPELATPAAWWDAVNRRYAEIFAAVGHPSAATAPALDALRDDILDSSRYVVFDDVIPALERAQAAGRRNVIVSNHIPELADLVQGLDLTRHFDGDRFFRGRRL